MNREKLELIRRVFGIIFALRGALYAFQAFIAYHALYGSLAENVFFIIFFALLALYFGSVSYVLLRGFRSMPSLRLSIAFSILVLDPAFFYGCGFPASVFVWGGAVAVVSTVAFHFSKKLVSQKGGSSLSEIL